jgi:RimJ/RimL family protein N-acetyltransferase
MVGDISLVKQEDGRYHLGYWLAEDYWGQGIMSTAVGEVLNTAKKLEKQGKVVSEVKEGNLGSRKVLEKNGFKYCGEQYSPETRCILMNFEVDLASVE